MLLDEHEITRPFAPFLAPVLRWVVQIYFVLVHYAYVLYNFTQKKQVVPAIRKNDPLDQLLLLPAVDAARKVWKKETTSAHLVEAYIRRAELVNKQINAIVQRNYDFARSRAKEIDQDLQKMDENSQDYKDLLKSKPFLGVPLSVKDHIGVKGIKLTVGLPCFANNPPMEDDAEIIKRLMSAGAIPLFYTNVPEGVMWLETENTIYGRTNNAYDQRKGVGGSSGGEGSILGAGASVFGVGSDIGGSIRAPAMFNGIFGLKPSPGLISWAGCVPDKFTGYQAEMASLGPLCRFAKDLRPMLKIMVDPEHREKLRLDEPVDVEKLRVFYMEGLKSLFYSPLDSDVYEALQKAVSHFQNTHSKSTIRVDLPLVDYTWEMWLTGMFEKGSMPVPNFFTGFDPNKALDGWAELPKWFSGTSEHVTSVLAWCIFYDFFAKFSYDTEKRIKMRETLRQQLLDLLGNDGVLIYPSFPHSGYFHNELLWVFTHSQATAVWNTIAFPVASVPMGLNSDGFPTAVQIVATPGNERLILKVAEELSQAFGGWVMPPGPEQDS